MLKRVKMGKFVNNFFGVFFVLSMIILNVFFVYAIDDLLALQGNVLEGGSSLQSGNLTIYIFDSVTGGNLIYNSTDDFRDSISQGKYDILLGNGSNELNLNYGNYYYIEMYVNDEKLNFDGVNRQIFQSSAGNISSMHINWSDSIVLPQGKNVSLGNGGFFKGTRISNGSDSNYFEINYIDLTDTLFGDLGTYPALRGFSGGALGNQVGFWNGIILLGEASDPTIRFSANETLPEGGASIAYSVDNAWFDISVPIRPSDSINIVGENIDIPYLRFYDSAVTSYAEVNYNSSSDFVNFTGASNGYRFEGGNTSFQSNVSADYFFGDGSKLTNLPGSANIFNQNLNTTNNVTFTNITVLNDVYINGVHANIYLYNQTAAGDNRFLQLSGGQLTGQLNVSSGGLQVTGDSNFNGGWTNGGVSVINGNVFAQTLFTYNITSLGVNNLDINGSLLPIGWNNTFDVGNETWNWRNGWFATEVYVKGAPSSIWLYNQSINIPHNSTIISINNVTDFIYNYNQTITQGTSNIFNQDLNTTNNVRFNNLTLSGNLTAQGEVRTFDRLRYEIDSSNYVQTGSFGGLVPWLEGVSDNAGTNSVNIKDDLLLAAATDDENLIYFLNPGVEVYGLITGNYTRDDLRFTSFSNYIFSENVTVNTNLSVGDEAYIGGVAVSPWLYNQTVASSGTSNIFNQNLNTTNNVRFNNITFSGNLSSNNDNFFFNPVTGSLGLNHSNPESQLHLRGVINGEEGIRIETLASSENSILAYNGNNQLVHNINYIAYAGRYNIYNNGTNTIQLASDTVSYLNGGNVGIGTATPQQLFNVMGNANVTGTLGVGGPIGGAGGTITSRGAIAVTGISSLTTAQGSLGAGASGVYGLQGSTGTYAGNFDGNVTVSNDILQGDDDRHYFGDSNNGQIYWDSSSSRLVIKAT